MLEASQEIFSPTAYNVKLRGFFPILSIRFDVFHVFSNPSHPENLSIQGGQPAIQRLKTPRFHGSTVDPS